MMAGDEGKRITTKNDNKVWLVRGGSRDGRQRATIVYEREKAVMMMGVAARGGGRNVAASSSPPLAACVCVCMSS